MTEYGVHWNFFYTLGAIRVFLFLLAVVIFFRQFLVFFLRSFLYSLLSCLQSFNSVFFIMDGRILFFFDTILGILYFFKMPKDLFP